jgi:hypothetical protein
VRYKVTARCLYTVRYEVTARCLAFNPTQVASKRVYIYVPNESIQIMCRRGISKRARTHTVCVCMRTRSRRGHVQNSRGQRIAPFAQAYAGEDRGRVRHIHRLDLCWKEVLLLSLRERERARPRTHTNTRKCALGFWRSGLGLRFRVLELELGAPGAALALVRFATFMRGASSAGISWALSAAQPASFAERESGHVQFWFPPFGSRPCFLFRYFGQQPPFLSR